MTPKTIKTPILILLLNTFPLSSCNWDKEGSDWNSTEDSGQATSCDNREDTLSDMEAHFNSLTQNMELQPADIVLPEDTNGTLNLGLNTNVFPILASSSGVFAAATQLGNGRIVAFSGQDFIGSSERSTLLGDDDISQMISNSVYWTSQSNVSTPPRVRVANDRLSGLLSDTDISDVTVAPVVLVDGLWSLQDWSEQALSDVDVAIIQVNEWGTLFTGPDDIEDIRAFVEDGGGLIIAGSALHYNWWLSDTAGQFIGDRILEGTGISWNINSVPDISTATLSFDSSSSPDALWCSYIGGEDLTDEQMVRLGPIFDSAKEVGRDEELDQALTRLISETPELPISVHNSQAKLSAEVSATLRPHEWPDIHPWAKTFPGLPSQDAVIENVNLTLDASYGGAIPVGAYAPPGELVTVSLSSGDVSRGVRIRVGELYDDLRPLDHIDTWERAPMLLHDFEVTETMTVVYNPFGGSISLVLPMNESGVVDVLTEGAIPMPLFTQGISSNSEWLTQLEKGAPQAILEEKGHVRMVVDSTAASSVAEPADVIDFWSRFHRSHADLASEPSPRMYESQWIFDVQVGWGYANATSNRITFPKVSESWALRTETGNEDWWLFGHELGHQFQDANWSGGDITEVAVNLFTMYTLNDYIFGGSDFETMGFTPNTIDHDMLESYRWDSADLFGKLQMYRQLVFEFGWPAFKDTFGSYHSPDYPISEYGEFMDGFALRFSAIVERDLVAFFEHWEYPMSSNAAAQIQEYGFEQWLPPGWE